MDRIAPGEREPVAEDGCGLRGWFHVKHVVFHDGLLWMSYYSSHEKKSSIYLAKIKLPQE